jgi:hypothetical protein
VLLAELRLVPLWIAGHARAMRERLPGKPLVLEEFGKVGSAVPIPDKFYYNVRPPPVSTGILL